MTFAARLRLVAGSGHLARRGDAVLFVPAGDERLVAAFTAARSGEELRAVASAVVEAGFDVQPYVVVAWSAGFRVMAFGDVAVETDQPTLPMLSGAGSRTWVEHTLEDLTSATIDVLANDVDPASNLVEGVALASGFQLELRPPAGAAPPVDAHEERNEGDEGDEGDEKATDRTEPVAVPSEDRPTVTSSVQPVVANDDPGAALAAIQRAAMSSEGVPLHPAGGLEAAQPVDVLIDSEPEPPSDITIPPVAVDAELAVEPSGALVEARLCPRGHPNAPAAASCAVCGAFLAPGPAALVNVVRPSLGRLELDDGSLVELDTELLIGRHPERDTTPERAALHRLRVDGEKVSRVHLEVRFQGWDVLVADCNSTNGTFVVPHPGGQVATLEPGRPQMVEEGAVVYFGSRSFTVQGRGVER